MVDIDDRVRDIERLKNALETGSDARSFLTENPYYWRAKDRLTGKTALHFAAEAGYVHVGSLLVGYMSVGLLGVRDNEGFTALARATSKGNFGLAKCILTRSKKLLTIQNDRGNIPAVAAIFDGYLDLALFLYLHTPPEILRPGNGIIGPTVVCEAIYNKALGKN